MAKLGVNEMASISNTVANLYNYTAPVTNSSMLNDQKTNGSITPSSIAQAKLSAETTLVSIGNKKVDPLTYNALGLLGSTNQSNLTQDPVLQVQSALADSLNSLFADTTANNSNDLVSQLNIPGVTTARR
jgi:hypothetical protein